MTNQTTYLVLGATGRHGGTGRFVAHELKARGYAVRALVRQDDERSRSLAASGIETIVGDLHDRASLIPALSGVATAYFTYPIAAGAVDGAANFAAAARESGLKRVVVMSMAVSRPESPSALGRAHWLAEEVLQWAGLETINLRIAALFAENIDLLHGHDLVEGGVLKNTFGDLPLSWITGDDAGRLAVAAMLHPERLKGETTIYPSGGAQVSHGEIAQALSEKLGRAIRHETVSRREWADSLNMRSLVDGRLNPDMADHISAVGVALRRTIPMNSLFEDIAGERPTSILDAIRSGALGGAPGSPLGA